MRSRVAIVIGALALVACAKASPGGGDDGDDTSPMPDAGFGGQPDADPTQPDAMPVPDAMPLPDAPPQVVTLSQNTDPNTVTPLNSVSCNQGGETRENSYYRAFTLSEHSVSGAFDITSVTIGIEEATAQTGQLRIHSYSGTVGTTLNTAQMTLLNGINVNIGAGSATMFVQPITATIPAGGTFVVELFIPDGLGTGRRFFIGSNASGQTKPGYIRAPITGCDITVPTSLTAINQPNMHEIITVTGNAF
jgi:hypothetical protein